MGNGHEDLRQSFTQGRAMVCFISAFETFSNHRIYPYPNEDWRVCKLSRNQLMLLIGLLEEV